MTEPLKFSVPVKGRFITGDMAQKRTIDHQGKPLPPEKQSYDFGIAFPKQEVWSLFAEQFFPYLHTAWQGDPQMIQRLNAWFSQPGLKGDRGGLSMKIGDGDAPNAKGQISENSKGCYVFYCNSFGMGDNARPPVLYIKDSTTGEFRQINVSQIKRGDYVTFSGSINPNGQQGNNAGAYMNCDSVWLIEEGAEISGGTDPNAAFGGLNITSSYVPPQGAAPQFDGLLGSAPVAPNSAPPSYGAPVAPQTAPAAPQAPPAAPNAAPTPTAYPGNAPAQPYPQILQPQPGAAPSGPPAAPPLPGLPGQS